MPAKAAFTKPMLDRLVRQKPDRQLTLWDTNRVGLCVLVSPGPAARREATVTFRVAYYLPSAPGRPVYMKLGRYTGKVKDIENARLQAAATRKAAAEGKDPRRPRLDGQAVEDVVARFMEEHARRNRTWRQTQGVFDRYVIPEWRGLSIEKIKRSDVAELLRRIAQKKIVQVVRVPGGKTVRQMIGGEASADATLAQVSKLFNWYALNYAADDFRSPIIRGMRRTQPKDRERRRYLSDDELRALWPALDGMGTYGAAVRAMLLTAQRVDKVMGMRRSDLKDRFLVPGREAEDGSWVADEWVEHVWDPTRDDDPKNKQVSVVPLSEAAREVVASVPVIEAVDGEDYVFTLNGRKPINGLSKFKARLDELMLAALREQAKEDGAPGRVELRPWQLRDLRRTARTLMSRAGVRPDVAERCLAHVMQGVEGVYDRYDYVREKRLAFEKLASLVDRIVNPPESGTVIQLAQRER